MSRSSFIVTGGAGFIGCNVVAELNRRGHEDILVVDEAGGGEAKQQNLRAVRFRELVDKDAFRRAIRGGKQPPPTAVFHLGACSSTTELNEDFLKDNNFLYTRELCEWCLANKVRFVYASSAATYGDGAQGYSDDDRVMPSLAPLNPYGRSKQMFDRWAMEQGLLNRIAGLKYFNVYGPHEDHKGDMRSVVNKAYQQILDTGEIRLFKSYNPRYADGEQERDFVYVRDAVDVTLFFHDHPGASGLFNCGTGQARTWLDLARAVFAAMNRPPKIVFVDMPAELRERYQYHTQADPAKLRRAGYARPFTSLEDGVRDYVQNYLAKREQS
jgi:ADP-L-glycero-D-manno-heptose 6-epimerase